MGDGITERDQSRNYELTYDHECVAAIRTKTKYRKIVVEGSRTFQTDALHHSKTRPIHQRKILIWIIKPQLPCRLKIRSSDRLDRGHALSQTFPKLFCSVKFPGTYTAAVSPFSFSA